MNKNQIFKILKSDPALKAENSLWSNFESKLSNMEGFKTEKNIKRLPIYRYGLMAACVVVLITGVLVVPKLNQIINLSSKDINSSSMCSSTTSLSVANNTDTSSLLQSSSTQVSSSVKSNSSKKSSSKMQVNGSMGSSTTIVPSIKGLSGNGNPLILNYNHKLYCTPSPNGFTDNMSAKPADVLGAIGTLKVCAIQNMDFLKNICIQDCNKNSIYIKYNYLCDETITIKGVTYILTNGYLSNILKVKSPSDPTASSSQSNNNLYSLKLIIYPSLNNVGFVNIVGKIIGKIATGSVYSIDEINPNEAVAINANQYWFVALKQYGYTGKTIEDVLSDKGLYQKSQIK